MRGMFITIEGGEGAGKSTNIAFVKEFLKKRGKKVLITREPGGTALGEKIRALLLDPDNSGMAHDTELLLMFAARVEHVAKVIVPALEAGQYVVCDRFIDATYAYQGGGRGISVERIRQLEQWMQPALFPDLTLLLDLPVDLGLERASNRGAKDRFEQERAAFFERVRMAYLERARAEPQRWHVVNAARPLKEVQAAITQVLESACPS